MENEMKRSKMRRQRKFFLILPLLVLPFLTLLFWALGGGKGEAATRDDRSQVGYNTHLPEPYFQDKQAENKYAYYQAAERDSAKLEEEIKNDPYYERVSDKTLIDTNKVASQSAQPSDAPLNKDPIIKSSSGFKDIDTDFNEIKVYAKLDQLNSILKEQKTSSLDDVAEAVPVKAESGEQHAAEDQDIAKLENMMQAMQDSGDNDPQMQQLSSMLDKIMAIQHPEIMQDSSGLQPPTNAIIFTASADPDLQQEGTIKTVDSVSETHLERTDANGFYGLNDNFQENIDINTIKAEVRETQKLVNGATIKLYLSNDIYLNSHLIPQGSPVYGTVDLNNERLQVTIKSIIYNDFIYPVSLVVYDLDGMEGIYIPGSIDNQVIREQSAQATNSLGLDVLDNSLKAQAANVGIQTAKSFLGHKARLESVTVKAGYQLLLKNSKG